MKHVMACIDGSAASATVCDYAAWASVRLAAPLTFLHVLDEHQYPQAPSNLSGNIGLGSREHLLEELAALDQKRSKLAREQGQFLLDAAKQRVDQIGIVHPQTRQRHGDLVDCLKTLEDEIQLLVIGRNGEASEVLSEHIGSHVENVIRTLQRPILLTPVGFTKPQRFLIAYDGSETGHKSIEMIAASPLLAGLDCHLLMVGVDSSHAWDQLNWAKEQLQGAGLNVTVSIRTGEVEQVIQDYIQDQRIDLLIMGAYGHSRIRQFLVGSTTSNMLRKTSVPLLLLR